MGLPKKDEKFTIDITPNWRNVYRWFMHIKRTDVKQYNHLIKTGGGEWENLLNMADVNGWNK